MDVNDLMKSEDYTRNYDIQDINDNKLMGVLAYLGLLVLIPIFASRNSKYAMFHAEQGLVLFILSVIVGGVFGALSAIPVIGFVFLVILSLLEIPLVILAILGIINSASGLAKQLPIIGGIKIFHLQ